MCVYVIVLEHRREMTWCSNIHIDELRSSGHKWSVGMGKRNMKDTQKNNTAKIYEMWTFGKWHGLEEEVVNTQSK